MTTSKSRFTPFFKQCFVTAAVCSDVIGHGCTIGFPAILLPQLRQQDTTIKITEGQASWIASTLGLSLLIGGILAPAMMGRFGRKPAHYVVILCLILAWFTCAMSASVTVLIVGRVFQGLSLGIFMPLRSVLLGEYTSPKNRAAFLAVISLAQGFGILWVHLIGSLLTWQWTCICCLIFPFASLIMTMYTPESPSWLAAKGNYRECRQVFHWLRGDTEEHELEEMIEARKHSTGGKNKKGLLKTITKKEFYKPILIMLHLYCMLSFSGSMTLSNYSIRILSILMGPNANPHFWMVFLDVQRFITNSMAVYVINRLKRRVMIFATLSLCIASHLAVAVYVYAKHEGYFNYNSIWLPAVLINLQYLSISTGMVPIPNVVAGEIFPLAYRSISGCISICFYAGTTFLALGSFNILLETVGFHGASLVYAGILSYTLIFIWFSLPETKGKTLQQIENEFKGSSLRSDELCNLQGDEMKTQAPCRLY